MPTRPGVPPLDLETPRTPVSASSSPGGYPTPRTPSGPAHRKLRHQSAARLTDRVADLCIALNFFALWGLTTWAYTSSILACITTSLASNTYSLKKGRDSANSRALAAATCLTGWLICVLVVNSIEFILGVFLLGYQGVAYAHAARTDPNSSGVDAWVAYCMCFSWVISGVNLGLTATVLAFQLELRLLLGLLSQDDLAATAEYVEAEHQAQTLQNLQRGSIHRSDTIVAEIAADIEAGEAVMDSSSSRTDGIDDDDGSARPHHHLHHHHHHRSEVSAAEAGMVPLEGASDSTGTAVAKGMRDRMTIAVRSEQQAGAADSRASASPVSPRGIRVVAMSNPAYNVTATPTK